MGEGHANSGREVKFVVVEETTLTLWRFGASEHRINIVRYEMALKSKSPHLK